MATMGALRITGKGGPEVLELATVPRPVPGPEELLVRVHAAALNRADLLQCKGLYPAPPGAPADIPGLEYAGEVEALGERAHRFGRGDRVMGIVGGGAFAEWVVVHERTALPIPASMGYREAAAIPEAFITAHDALAVQGSLRPSEHVLIHAVGSGVGTAALQLVRAWRAIAIGTARTQAKLDRCRAELGLAHAILVNPDLPTFQPQVLEATGDRGAAVALDLVGGRYLPETLRSMAPQGRVLLVGTLAGAAAELDLGLVLRKRLRLQGTVLRSRPLEEKIQATLAFQREVLPLFESGALKPLVDEAMPFERAREAFARISSNETLGKVVLQWSP